MEKMEKNRGIFQLGQPWESTAPGHELSNLQSYKCLENPSVMMSFITWKTSPSLSEKHFFDLF